MRGSRTYVISLAVFLHLSSFTAGQLDFGRIINGDPATPHEFPFLAEIRRGGQHVCGGSILSAQWILTSGFCASGGTPEDFQVVVGEHDLSVVDGNEQFIPVSNIFIHPDFISSTRENDIALLQLSQDVRFNPNVVERVKLEPPEDYVESPQALVMGWGVRLEPSTLISNTLNKATVFLQSRESCAAVYANLDPTRNISENVLCAGPMDSGPCRGDNGGPLICSSQCGMPPVQCGIVSFGRRCGIATVPGVYTRVSKFISFILDKTSTNARPSERIEL